MKMNWDAVKSVVGKSAPLIGTLLGGPAGGAVATMVAGALGVEDTPDAISSALSSDPSAMLKIKELEFTHKVDLERLALEDTRARLADTQNARHIEIERLKAGQSNRFQYILAALVVIAFFAVIGMLFFKAIPEGAQNVAYMLLGTLAAEFGSVMRYFFGSSKGSADKTAMLVGNKK